MVGAWGAESLATLPVWMLAQGAADGSGISAAGGEPLVSWSNLAALMTLTLLEIVLGIDNIVFLSILTGKLKQSQQKRARKLGLVLAMGARIALLLGIGFVMRLTEPIMTLLGRGVSLKDMIMIAGGGFLLAKGTMEIYANVEGDDHHTAMDARAKAAFGAVLVQIVAMDMIFSLDSVITAVGMADHIAIMIAAIVVAVGIMMLFAEVVSSFIEAHPSIKILALAFLVLIGVLLVAEGFGEEINKGYIYAALAFSLVVEGLQIRASRKNRSAP